MSLKNETRNKGNLRLVNVWLSYRLKKYYAIPVWPIWWLPILDFSTWKWNFLSLFLCSWLGWECTIFQQSNGIIFFIYKVQQTSNIFIIWLVIDDIFSFFDKNDILFSFGMNMQHIHSFVRMCQFNVCFDQLLILDLLCLKILPGSSKIK